MGRPIHLDEWAATMGRPIYLDEWAATCTRENHQKAMGEVARYAKELETRIEKAIKDAKISSCGFCLKTSFTLQGKEFHMKDGILRGGGA